MYIDTAYIKSKNKNYKRVLLRTSFRDKGKVKHKTIANLSDQSSDVIEAIRFALKNKQDVQKLLVNNSSKPILGYSIGAVWVLNEIAKRLHIDSVLGNKTNGKLALWQVIARVIDQGSRLSAVRLAGLHATCEVLHLESFTEDDLYQSLKWLSQNQEQIEIKLFSYKDIKKTSLFLYDVTSSYAEGQENAYAEYGYNRDKKKGKKQIVIGLLTDMEGDPVSVQVFKGNTSDPSTFVEQVHKIIEKFHVQNVIMVGDRGMIKKPQIDQLPESFFYVTAITKAQINVLIKNKKIKLEDFSEKIYEVQDKEMRYILKRNSVRAQEIEFSRESKFSSLQKKLQEKNVYLKEHHKSSIKTALNELKTKAKLLHIDSWIKIENIDRQIICAKDLEKLKSQSLLDGCYVLKTDVLKSEENTSEIIHERYKDLKHVEWAFRTMKTTHLEIRPYYVRRAVSTEGHVFVVMLAYKMIRYLKQAWSSLNITIEEGVHELSSIRGITNEEKKYQTLPQLDERAKELIEKLNIELPQILPMRTCCVATRKKLIKRS